MKTKVENIFVRCARCGVVVFYFLLSTFAFAAPSPTPSVLTPTSTVKFTWEAPVTDPQIPPPISYDFLEKVSGNWKYLGNPTKAEFVITNIGAQTRTFAVRARNANGVGVIKEFVFPGMPAGGRFYLEVQIK